MDLSFLATNDQLAEQFVASISEILGISFPLVAFVLLVVVIWSLVWKLLALWKSARNRSVIWFIVLALTNTLGILPILYIYVFSKMGARKSKEVVKKKGK